MKEIAILGLGNLMRSDDAIGVLTVAALARCHHLLPKVRLIEGGTLGLDLLDSLWGVTHLVAVDAVDAGEEPGTLLRFSGERLSLLPLSKSVHLLGFADLMGVMTLMNVSPLEVVLLGMQPAATGWGTELTPVLQARQDVLFQAVVAQVQAWTSPQVLARCPAPTLASALQGE